METLQVPRMLSVLTLSVCCVFASGQISAEQSCSLSIPDNKALFDELSTLFDRDSQIAIIEYTVRIRNDSGGFNLYEGSSPDSFQPWKWYRTQGRGSSHLLLTSDFYFGFLKTLLGLGIKKFDLDLHVSPAGCLQGAEHKTSDNLIKNFLLKDLGLGDYSPHWSALHSDALEICTTWIDGINGKGKLVYRCCSYNAEKQIICDDDSADDWACLLNVAILTLSCLLVVSFYVKFGTHNNIGGKNIKEESDNYILEHTYRFLLYHKSTENTPGITCVPSDVLDSMPKLKAKLNPSNGNFVVTVRKTSVNMHRNQLLGEDDQVHLLQNCFDDLFLLRDKRPKKKRAATISVLMLMLIASCIPFYYFMLWQHGWYEQLVDAFGERGLQGPFYFQWSCNLKAQIFYVYIFLALHAVFTIFCICTYTFWPCLSDKTCCKFSCKCFLTCVLGILLLFPGSMLLLVGTLFLVSFSVMLVFTVIVQANTWTTIIQVVLTLPFYVLNYYHDYFRPHNALKSKLLKLFEKEPRLNAENTVSAITHDTLDNAFRRLGIDKKDQQWSNPNIEFEIMSQHLQLTCKRPFLFVSEDGAPLITRDFLESSLKGDCKCPKVKCPKCDCIQEKCKWICLKFLHVLPVGLALVLTGTFIALVIIMVKAYSDIYHIYPSNRFFISFITSLGPLVVKHFNNTSSSQRPDGALGGRFEKQLRTRINNCVEHMAVNDFTDFDVDPLPVEAPDINPKLKYAIQDAGQECPLLLHQCCPC